MIHKLSTAICSALLRLCMGGLRACVGLCLALAACAPEVHKASTRNPDLFEKAGSNLHVAARQSEGPKPPELFTRTKEIKIDKVERPSETGSLFRAEDERNDLFSSAGPRQVGKYVDVKILSGRSQATGEAGKDQGAPAPGSEVDSKKPVDEVEKELLAALPELAPAKPNEARLIERMKMRIAHRFDNGDVMVSMLRSTLAQGQAAEAQVSARIPYDRLISGDELTTKDLMDVKIVDSRDGEVAERRSSGWEDEYSLRLSGFTEAKSKAAAEIDEKRRRLEDARENLKTRIKTFSEERKQVAKEREAVRQKAEEQKKVDEVLAAKDEEIKDKAEEISEKEKEITSLIEKAEEEKSSAKAGAKEAAE